MKTSKRYVSKAVRSLVAKNSRGRCCLCRQIILPENLHLSFLGLFLERHHIIHLAERGPNTGDNLMEVCASCHSKIHLSRSPEYSPEKLRAARDHWRGMETLIPCKLAIPSKGTRAVCIGVRLESVNLKFEIECTQETPLSVLGEFVRREIVLPLGEYDKNKVWLSTDFVDFCNIKSPEVAVGGFITVGSLTDSGSHLLRVRLSTRLTVFALQPIKRDIESGEYFEVFRKHISPKLGGVVRLIQNEAGRQRDEKPPPYMASFGPVPSVSGELGRLAIETCDALSTMFSDARLPVSFKEIRRALSKIDQLLAINLYHPMWQQPLHISERELCEELFSYLRKFVRLGDEFERRVRFHYFSHDDLQNNFFDWNNFRLAKGRSSEWGVINLSLEN